MHQIDIKVRGYHLDLYGHVNNARYLEFLEEARWAYFDDEADLVAYMHEALPSWWSTSTSVTGARR